MRLDSSRQGAVCERCCCGPIGLLSVPGVDYSRHRRSFGVVLAEFIARIQYMGWISPHGFAIAACLMSWCGRTFFLPPSPDELGNNRDAVQQMR